MISQREAWAGIGEADKNEGRTEEEMVRQAGALLFTLPADLVAAYLEGYAS